MQASDMQVAIQAIAGRFVQLAPEGWARLVGNWEATPTQVGTVTLNYITLAVVDGGDRWLLGQFDYDEELYDMVAALRLAMAEGAPWTVFDLEVDADGSYRTHFGYDDPKRSNGIEDEESMGRFENYLDRWVAEHGPTPTTPR